MAYTTTSVSAIRFDHIAIAVPRIAEATPVLVGELGGGPAYGAPARGIVVQFAEAPRGGEGARRWRPPPGPPHPPPPVTIVGLRLRAHARDRSQTQWASVLQGESGESADGRLIYRWPGSPMRIAVEIDGSGEEGPIAVELGSHRPVSLPAGAHPLLGAVFTRCPAP